MNVKEQIDYMIQSLQLAKSEIEYAEKYMDTKKKDKDFYQWNHMGYNARQPNGTIIRESLKMVGRLANVTASNVILSAYSEQIFKN